VVSAAHFDRWWSRARKETPDLLTFTMEQLVGDASVDTSEFPEKWPQGELSLPLTYQFQPGSEADGVTVHIPIAVLARVVPDGFDWMVPGLLEELTVATIKSLPKAVRRELVPAPDVARDVVAWIREECPAWEDIVRAGDMAEPYVAAFTRAVRALRDVVVPPEVWDEERISRLPGHLRMTFRVVEERGRGRDASAIVLDESKDLLLLQRKLAGRAEAAVRSAVKGAVGRALAEARAGSGSVGAGAEGEDPRADAFTGPRGPSTSGRNTSARGSSPSAPSVGMSPSEVGARSTRGGGAGVGGGVSAGAGVIGERSGLASWPEGLADGGVLPESVSTDVGAGVVVRGFPALVEEAAPKVKGQARSVGVALRILADETQRDALHAAGVRRLLVSEAALGTGRITSRWTGTQSLTMAASPYPNTEALVTDLQLAAVVSLTSPAGSARYDTPPGGPDAASVRSASAYADALAFVRQHLEDEVYRVVGHVVAALSASRTLEAEVRASGSLALLNTLQDIREHRASLIHDGFVAATPPRRLPHLARYLRADSHRLTKAAENPARDSDLAWRIGDVTAAYEKALAVYTAGSPDAARAAELADVRWLLEELRVSLFAQQLGTDGSVSEKRIRKVLVPNGW
jgi:ATP-dependent helicase HrpA